MTLIGKQDSDVTESYLSRHESNQVTSPSSQNNLKFMPAESDFFESNHKNYRIPSSHWFARMIQLPIK